MMIVSTRDFRSNQTKYLNLAKSGENVVLHSRAGSFKISPIAMDNEPSKGQMVKDLRHALQEVADSRNGIIKLQTAEDLLDEL